MSIELPPWDEADRGHVGGPDGLDLVHGAEAILPDQVVKVGDDLVEQSEALDALVVAVQLGVELVKVGDAGEDDADAVVRLRVQLHVAPELVVQEVGGHVPRQQVEEDALVGALEGGNSIGLKTCRRVAQMSN